MSKYLPFVNSRFVQEREWPTPAVGPNYTRAVFAENGPGGNFARSPILVAGGRSFAGLGADMNNQGGIFSSKNVLGALGASGSSQRESESSTCQAKCAASAWATSSWYLPSCLSGCAQAKSICDTGNASNFSVPKDVFSPGTSTQECNSDSVIRSVQAAIGAGVDGKWGALSTAALAKSGKSFQALAPGCTGNPPPGVSSGGGGGGGTTTVTGGGVSTTSGGGSNAGSGTSAASMFNNPMIWVVLAAVAAGGIILFGGKEKKPMTSNRRRSRRRS